MLSFILFIAAGVLHLISAVDRSSSVPWANLAWACFCFGVAAMGYR